MKIEEKNLVWIDLEMTGLDSATDHILEIATIITDDQLNILDPGISFIIHQPRKILDAMSPWCKDQHTRSGLLEASCNSTVSLDAAMEKTLTYIQQWSKAQSSPLCGNSIYQDRAFLRRYMPKIDSFLHYRIIDVSSVKELVLRWYAHDPMSDFKKSKNHRALEDIQESIAELRHYRTYFFK